MKSGFYYTNPERKNQIKNLKILFQYKITIKMQKNAIIIITHDIPDALKNTFKRPHTTLKKSDAHSKAHKR